MKHFLFALLYIAVSTTLSAQGLTRFGEIKSGSSNDFVDKNGRLGSIPMLDANGKVLFELTTSAVSTITNNTASCGGNVFSVVALTARGVCWSTSPNPVASGSHTADGTSTGVFASSITGLSSGTLYYVRAYATNSYGTGYGNEISFTTTGSALTTVSDADNNVYATVTIGTQVWMAENLKTTKYNDGTSIPNIADNAAWAALSTPGFCWYDNNSAAYKNTYGALYNWYAVSTTKLAPEGWHVATDADWKQLEMTLGMTLAEAEATGWRGTDQGAQLKTTSGWSYGGNGSNTSGFSAPPGGSRLPNGEFRYLTSSGVWWSATEISTTLAWLRHLFYTNSNVYRDNNLKTHGFSVRCVRD